MVMKTRSIFYKLRLGALGALGFGSLISCNPTSMYGPAPVMYGPGPDMYGPPTELLPESEVPENADVEDVDIDIDADADDASK